MKKTIYAFAVVSSLILVSCGGDKTEDASGDGTEQSNEEGTEEEENSGQSIVGTWGLSDLDMGMEIPADQQARFDEMMNTMKENTSYTFKADGTLDAVVYAGERMETSGTYKVGDGSLELTMDGKTENLKMDLSDDTMVLSGDSGGVTATMTFTRK